MTDGKQKLSKRRIALIQLRQSVTLLEQGDAVSALTLAGAAEEILGRIAVRRGRLARVEYNADWIGSMYDWAKKPRPAKKKLISALNEIRNHLKHQDDGRNIRIEADFRFEAEEMILRAIFNHYNAFGCWPANRRLRDWFMNVTLLQTHTSPQESVVVFSYRKPPTKRYARCLRWMFGQTQKLFCFRGQRSVRPKARCASGYGRPPIVSTTR